MRRSSAASSIPPRTNSSSLSLDVEPEGLRGVAVKLPLSQSCPSPPQAAAADQDHDHRQRAPADVKRRRMPPKRHTLTTKSRTPTMMSKRSKFRRKFAPLSMHDDRSKPPRRRGPRAPDRGTPIAVDRPAKISPLSSAANVSPVSNLTPAVRPWLRGPLNLPQSGLSCLPKRPDAPAVLPIFSVRERARVGHP
jgi:hypothetical protein